MVAYLVNKLTVHEENDMLVRSAVRAYPNARSIRNDNVFVANARSFGRCLVDLIVDGSGKVRVSVLWESFCEAFEQLFQSS